MASKEIKDVNDSDGREENYQRQLTFLNEAVDGVAIFFRFLVVHSPPPGTKKEIIPHPRAPDRPQIHF